MHFEFTKHTKLYGTTSISVITLKLETRRKGKNPITDTVVAVWGEREVVGEIRRGGSIGVIGVVAKKHRPGHRWKQIHHTN